MSTGSIGTSGSNYISNATLMEWLELKSEELYAKMRDSMDTSNSRVGAEDALNDIKATIDDLKASGADAGPLRDKIEETLSHYGADFPEVRAVLGPIAQELTDRFNAAQPQAAPYTPTTRSMPNSPIGAPANGPGRASANPPPGLLKIPSPVPRELVKISSEDAKRWTDQIKDKVDTLGKQDQLGMVHLQNFNAQLNRAKDTASALMASADKAADNIVAHIG